LLAAGGERTCAPARVRVYLPHVMVKSGRCW
jgi:hypothetical protein